MKLRAARGRVAERIAAITLAALVAGGVGAPWLSPAPPPGGPDVVADRLQPPSTAHWLGTDASARDVLSRMLHGTRVSLGVAALSTLVVLVIGVAWGGVAGTAPPALDRWMMRFVDALLATPRLLIVLALVAFTQRLSVPALAVLLGLTGWAPMSRIVRARVRELAVTDYVAAARALGTPERRVLIRHILPGTFAPVLAGTVLAIATVIPLEAALSFFGVGVAPPTPSWGVLLRDASTHPLDAWWLLVFPTLAIAATVLSVNVLGDRWQRRMLGADPA